MVVRVASGAERGYGATHSQTLDAWLLNVPGIKVIVPAFPQDAKYLLKAAIRDNNPIIFNENKLLYSYADYVDDNIDEIPIGKARCVRQGTDISLIAYSRMVHEALKAAEKLAEQGIQAEVIDLRTLYPLDIDTLVTSVKKTEHAVCIEEGISRWGVCAEIVARLQEQCFDALKAPIGRVGMADIPIPCSFQLEQNILPNAKAIQQHALKVLKHTLT
jgi:pyruvate dehydrogenase E1 component beta subunit